MKKKLFPLNTDSFIFNKKIILIIKYVYVIILRTKVVNIVRKFANVKPIGFFFEVYKFIVLVSFVTCFIINLTIISICFSSQQKYFVLL
jgi:hypothetical protein